MLSAVAVLTPGMLAALFTSFASTAGVTMSAFLSAPMAVSMFTTVLVLYSAAFSSSMTMMSPLWALLLKADSSARRLTFLFRR